MKSDSELEHAVHTHIHDAYIHKEYVTYIQKSFFRREIYICVRMILDFMNEVCSVYTRIATHIHDFKPHMIYTRILKVCTYV